MTCLCSQFNSGLLTLYTTNMGEIKCSNTIITRGKYFRWINDCYRMNSEEPKPTDPGSWLLHDVAISCHWQSYWTCSHGSVFFSIQIKKDYEEKVRNVWHIEKSQSKQGTNRTCQKKRSAFRSRSWSFCDTQNISNYRKLKESVAQGSSLTAWRAKGIRVCVCVCAL